jgi:hypothetical protein
MIRWVAFAVVALVGMVIAINLLSGEFTKPYLPDR